MKIKKGDTVEVIAGKDRGKRGEVLRVLPVKSRVIVQGLNLRKKHQKGGQSAQGRQTAPERLVGMRVGVCSRREGDGVSLPLD